MEIIKKNTAFIFLFCIAVLLNYAGNTGKINTFHYLLMKDEKHALQTTMQHNHTALTKGEMNAASFVIDLLTPAMGTTFTVMQANEMQQISTDVGTMYAANNNLIYVLIGKPYLPELNESKTDMEEKIIQRAKEYGRQLGDKGALIYLSPVLTKDRQWNMPAYLVTAVNNNINNNGEIIEYLETSFNEIIMADAKDVVTARAYDIMNMMQGGSNPNPKVTISETQNTNYGFDTKNNEGYTYVSVEKDMTTEINIKIESGDANEPLNGTFYLETLSSNIEIVGSNQLTINNGKIDQNIIIKGKTSSIAVEQIKIYKDIANEKTIIGNIGALIYEWKERKMWNIENTIVNFSITPQQIKQNFENVLKQGIVNLKNTPTIKQITNWDNNNNEHLDLYPNIDDENYFNHGPEDVFHRNCIVLVNKNIYFKIILKENIKATDIIIELKKGHDNVYINNLIEQAIKSKTILVGNDNMQIPIYNNIFSFSGTRIVLNNCLNENFDKTDNYVIIQYAGLFDPKLEYIIAKVENTKINTVLHELLHLDPFGKLQDIDNPLNLMHYQETNNQKLCYRFVNGFYPPNENERQWKKMRE